MLKEEFAHFLRDLIGSKDKIDLTHLLAEVALHHQTRSIYMWSGW